MVCGLYLNEVSKIKRHCLLTKLVDLLLIFFFFFIITEHLD